jgi:hypothetical protein
MHTLQAPTPMVLEQTRLVYRPLGLHLFDRVREVIRRKHCSIRTEEAYVDWTRRFVRFCDLRHCSAIEVQLFPSYLAVPQRVRNQRNSALRYLSQCR